MGPTGEVRKSALSLPNNSYFFPSYALDYIKIGFSNALNMRTYCNVEEVFEGEGRPEKLLEVSYINL